MRDYWELFATFSKLGLFTFGGGYAMLPLLESEIVEKRFSYGCKSIVLLCSDRRSKKYQ